jgi:hypothetical protein
MTTATVREAIHERLDPVIEEIVAREISQRGGYARGLGQEQGSSFEALMPVLLSTLMQRRQAGQGPQEILQNLLPVLPVLIQNITRRQGGLAGQEPQQILQNILPVLPALLPLLTQRRQYGQEPEQILQSILPVLPVLLKNLTRRQGGLASQEPQQILQNILPVLPALLPLLMQRRQYGQEPEQILQNILPVLPALLPAIMQRRQAGQEHPLQTLAPVLVAALSACS